MRDAQTEFVTIVSTRTIDRVPTGDGQVMEVPGGPVTYMTRAFDRLLCEYRVVNGDVAMVDVIRQAGGEAYVIPPLPSILMPPRLTGQAVILSPIVGEIDPLSVPPADGMLVVDLQGFVREPGLPTSDVSRQFEMADLLSRAAVVKASEHELERLTPGSRRVLDRSLLVVTLGSRGSIIHHDGRQSEIPTQPVAVQNTIGAGDTFLAGFVHALMAGMSPRQAALDATRFVGDVLRERASAESPEPRRA